ncbi:MAG: glycosyl transferase [Sphingopyxis sp.]|nr:glycosyl transferase [Sphingopyxis sp.]
MIRFAIPPIGGKGWFGGWMYMQNLVRALAAEGDRDIETLLCVGPDRYDAPEISAMANLERTKILCDPAFNEDAIRAKTLATLLTGRHAAVVDVYKRENVDVALDPAVYLGWRSGVPSIAWIPDFQHRHMPQMFSQVAWWKRDIGFRAQIASCSSVMLSSEDAERDCVAFYPAAKGKTGVARFAVSVNDWPNAATAWNRLRQEGIPEDFVFLPNQLWQHKNHRLAIEAASLLARQGSKRVILATGHGYDPRFPGYPDLLKAQIVASGAEQNFRFIGNVDHALVQALMICANGLLNPSLFEGWSTPVEEAKAVGTPMLLSDLSVHREQAPDARFFGTKDASSLASAIAVCAPRRLDSINDDMAKAAGSSKARQQAFAASVHKLVRDASMSAGGRMKT